MSGPRMRATQVGREAIEAMIAPMIAEGSFTHGWMIVGGEGAGKATLAYRIARALLDPNALSATDRLDMPTETRAFRLAAQGAHPDLFVAERRLDPKTERRETEISIDTIRELIAFMSRTAALGGWRVAIVDTADDLNKNSANALLKVLEEPPMRATLLLLTSAPGRLLPTIRSRCRRMDLRPVPDSSIAALLEAEAGVSREEAARIAAVSAGRPGFALTLATGEGGEAITAVDSFMESATKNGDATAALAALSGKAGDARWEIFRYLTVDRIAQAARAAAAGEAGDRRFDGAGPAALSEAYHQIAELFGRGDALNADRSQMVLAAGRLLKRALAGRP
jgi:DNA polymerase-3 subunit delta'